MKRALWLDLQEQPNFDKLNSLAELRNFASQFLQANPQWLHDSFDTIARQKFIEDTCLQVLGLGYYIPDIGANHLHIDEWKQVDSFLNIASPIDLHHFQAI